MHATRKRTSDLPSPPPLSLETSYVVASSEHALAQIEAALEDEMRRYRRCEDCADAQGAYLDLYSALTSVRDAMARLRRRQGEAIRVVAAAGAPPF